jgi:hypothetical protein
VGALDDQVDVPGVAAAGLPPFSDHQHGAARCGDDGGNPEAAIALLAALE